MARLKAWRFNGSTSSSRRLRSFNSIGVPIVLRFLVHLLQQLAQVGGRQFFAAVTLGEGEVVLEHVLHLANVCLQRLRLGRVAE